MKKPQWNELILTNDFAVLERNLLYSFLRNKNLNYEKSVIINRELAEFEPDQKIQTKISDLKITTLKDLEQHLEGCMTIFRLAKFRLTWA